MGAVWPSTGVSLRGSGGAASELGLDEVVGLTDGGDVLQVVFGHRDAELFLECHHHLDHASLDFVYWVSDYGTLV